MDYERGGLQISMLGVIGEYLWRTLDESRKKPLYFIEKSIYSKKELWALAPVASIIL